MSLQHKTWSRASIHDVNLAWLRAERARYPKSREFDELLDAADLGNLWENRERLRLLYMTRLPLTLEIPPDTEWHLVKSLTEAEVNELHAINESSWNDPADNNELRVVAMRKKISLNSDPLTWDTPILWGHDRCGPFTIMEGNNRLTAYAASGRTDLDIAVYVGLSPVACHWHLLDRVPLQSMLRPR